MRKLQGASDARGLKLIGILQPPRMRTRKYTTGFLRIWGLVFASTSTTYIQS